MKIIFDCRYTRLVRHDGISRYTAGLVAAFAKLHPVTMLIHDERQLTMLPDLPWIKSRRGTSLLEPFISLLSLNREKPDLVYSPMQMIGSIGRRFRLILTLHDMVFYRTRTPPTEFSWPIRLGWFAFHLCYWPQRAMLNRADAVVTGSYNSENEMRHARLTSRRLEVIRPGVDNIGVDERQYPTAKTLIYMGTFMPNKNVECLARAMHLLPGYTLRLLSRIDEETRTRLTGLAPVGSLQCDNGVTDEEYQVALASATAMVTACRDEGFGIPLIESEAAGTPLIVSDITLFHEVCGAAAVYFDQESPENFAAAVLEMDNPVRWEQLSRAALTQAELFTWAESADRLFALIGDVIGTPLERIPAVLR